ncbi:hypothetical protein DE146DRAFT_155093 [Phaeosphaeria sp. MPI-PUGE-AT-0046c]|nr:hypothetical protein DE146DRAFT_155093 [Phaeosphaeria sp. MPI-PUGE-AT-0046c]
MPLFVSFAASISPALGSHMPPPRADLALLARVQLAAHMAEKTDFQSKDLDRGRHAVIHNMLHKKILKPMWHLSLKATCTPLPITIPFDSAFCTKPLLPRPHVYGRLLQPPLWQTSRTTPLCITA